MHGNEEFPLFSRVDLPSNKGVASGPVQLLLAASLFKGEALRLWLKLRQWYHLRVEDTKHGSFPTSSVMYAHFRVANGTGFGRDENASTKQDM